MRAPACECCSTEDLPHRTSPQTHRKQDCVDLKWHFLICRLVLSVYGLALVADISHVSASALWLELSRCLALRGGGWGVVGLADSLREYEVRGRGCVPLSECSLALWREARPCSRTRPSSYIALEPGLCRGKKAGYPCPRHPKDSDSERRTAPLQDPSAPVPLHRSTASPEMTARL